MPAEHVSTTYVEDKPIRDPKTCLNEFKDFLVSAFKEAFPEGLTVENPRNPVDRPLPQNNALENAKVI